ncbi:MAG: OmpA family protein [Alphaproteobacteria bacterium]|nr:OmpA family protein [Alphaproteobacteria bacterium]
MKNALMGAAALIALPMVAANAQSMFTPGQSSPGFYIGAEGGLNWLLNSSGYQSTSNFLGAGYAIGGKVGYDFVGPRVELEGLYHNNSVAGTVYFPAGPAYVNGQINQVSVMANLLYDFAPGATITPYVGAGAGIAFVDPGLAGGCTMCSTQFAYQGIVGLGYNIDPNWRINLDGRYYGTTNTSQFQNNNIALMLGVSYKFGQAETVAAPPPAPAPVAAPSFMVFFDWDRSDLSAQAVNTIHQVSAAFKQKGSARVTATGHTDRSGPDDYNMALSLRRANAVKDALVRDGVPATAISVIGRGESQPLVPTADGVREPQNRRVEIVLQ